VKDKQRLASPAQDEAWTRPEAYVVAMARKRGFRRAHAEKLRTQPESPRLLLSTVPFLLLIGLLAVLVVAIAVTAYPGSQPELKPTHVAAKERGVAERGWYQEAEREMKKH
jgi:hypothetical protein